MESQTLEDLKRENAEEEAKLAESEQEVEAEEEESEEQEAEESEPEGEPQEPWMKADDQASEGQPSEVPIKAHVKAVKKLKGKVHQKDEENQELKAKVEELQRQIESKPQPVIQANKPTRDQFRDNDDPEEAYIDALTDWKIGKHSQKYEKTVSESRQIEESKRKLETTRKSVDQHYERAETLVSNNGIAPDAYQEADTRVRQAIDAVRKGQGDSITDQMIALLGEGSEKVFFYLGVNEVALAQLQSKLTADSSGLTAVAYLSEIKATKTARQNKQSRAAKPAPNVNGDTKPAGRGEKALKKAYQSESNVQKRFNIRQEGRQAGFNVNEW